MAIDTAPDKAPEMAPVSIYRLTVEQFHAMAEAGILTDDDRVELLEGWLITKMTKNPRHVLVARRIFNALALIAPLGCFVGSQDPITLSGSEPEPDAALIRGKFEDYIDRHPFSAEVALVIEVSDAALQQDQRAKLRIFARARIPLYWIVNLIDNRLEVYSDPMGDGDAATYSRHTDSQPTDEVPVILDGQQVARLPLSALFA